MLLTQTCVWGAVFTVSPGLMFIDGIHGDGNGRVYLLLSCLMHLVRWQEYQTVTWETDPEVSDISAGIQLCISIQASVCSCALWHMGATGPVEEVVTRHFPEMGSWGSKGHAML